MADSQGVVAHRRRTTGCNSCRQRRVKCDEIHPVCNQCQRMELTCSWRPDHAHARRPRPPIARNSGLIICSKCRADKVKCNRERPSCSRCLSRRADCVYPNGLEASTTRTEEVHPRLGGFTEAHQIRTPTPRDLVRGQRDHLSLFEDRHLVSMHIDAYFKHVHPVGCFGFLHEPTIRNAVQQQTISSTLLLAMYAASTRFVDHSVSANEVLRLGQLWADEAKTMIFQRLVDYDLDVLASLVLSFHHALASAQFETIRLLAPVAARMAMALGLCAEVEPSEEDRDFAEPIRETRRRLVWACQVFDWFTGAGERSSMSFKVGMIKVRLPTSDEDFEVERASDMPFLEEDYNAATGHRRQSRLGAYIWLMSLKAKVIQHAEDCREGRSTPWLPDSTFDHLDRTLSGWQRHLDPSLRVHEDPGEITISNGSFGALFMLETWYHDICATLFAIAVPSATHGFHVPIGIPSTRLDQAPPDWVSRTRNRCIEHCAAVSGPARRATALRPDFVFEDADFALTAIESVWLRMAWLKDDPESALKEEVIVPMALHIERTSQLVAATRIWFPMVEPLLAAVNDALLEQDFPAVPSEQAELNPDRWYQQTLVCAVDSTAAVGENVGTG